MVSDNNFSSTISDEEDMKLVANKTVHKNHIDEAFLLAIKNISNVVIVTKNKDEIIANRNILTIFSSLLRSLLQDSGSTLLLPDCSSSSVRHVLNIITNSFTKIEKDSLDDLNDVIETARVMEIDISNIYVEQSLLASPDESSFTSGLVTPSTQKPPGFTPYTLGLPEFVTPSNQRPPEFSESTDPSGDSLITTLSSMHTSDLNGSLWWLSGFSGISLDERKPGEPATCKSSSTPSQISGFVNSDGNGKYGLERSDFTDGSVKALYGSESMDSESTWSSGFVNLPPKEKGGKNSTLNGSESVIKSKLTPTSGFSNVDPPSQSEHFDPEHNSTKLNGTPINSSNASTKSGNLVAANNEVKRVNTRKKNGQERLIQVPKQVGKSNRGNGHSGARVRHLPGAAGPAMEVGGISDFNQEGKPIDGEASKSSEGKSSNEEGRSIPDQVSGVSRRTGQSTTRAGRRNMSVGTIIKFLDQSDDECEE